MENTNQFYNYRTSEYESESESESEFEIEIEEDNMNNKINEIIEHHIHEIIDYLNQENNDQNESFKEKIYDLFQDEIFGHSNNKKEIIKNILNVKIESGYFLNLGNFLNKINFDEYSNAKFENLQISGKKSTNNFEKKK